MKIVNKTFYRLAPAPGADPAAILESPVLTHPKELIGKVKRLDGIVVGIWDADAEQGRVHALGIVQRVDGESAEVEWRRVNFTLRPTGQGAAQWRKRPVFKFADLVAERYRLMDRFHDAFTTETRGNLSAHIPVVEAAAPIKAVASPGAEPVKSAGPQCNRVSPSGEIFTTPERGLFMGNRTSPPRWLICDLHFKRDLKEPRKYTKLFFLDEAVALAAGHRPCSTCRREQYQSYLAAVRLSLNVDGAGDLDSKLDRARRNDHARFPIAFLPDGAFIATGDGEYRLKWGGALPRWTPGGYADHMTPADLQIHEATVLTPEPSLVALRNGYAVVVHPSAR